MKTIGIIYERELDFGGVETHLLSLFRLLSSKGYAFIVFSPVSKNFQLRAGSNVQFYPIKRFSPFDFSIVHQFHRLFKEFRIDLVHTHSPIASIPGRLAAHWCKLPCLVTVHAPSHRYYGTRKTFRARAGRFLYIAFDQLLNYLFSDQFIYVSEHIFRESIKRRITPLQRSMVVPNGIDLSSIPTEQLRARLREHYKIQNNDLVIAYSGRLDAEKGVDILIRAFDGLDASIRKNFHLWMIGSEQKDWINKYPIREDTQKQIQWIGYQSNAAEFLAASDIFILPSLNEAMSFSLLEAMAAGLAIIVTNVGDNPLLIENDCQGLVVPPGNIHLLKNAISDLAQDSKLRSRLSKAAKEKSERYSDIETANAIEKVYIRLLGPS